MRKPYWMTTYAMDTVTEEQELNRLDEIDNLTDTPDNVRQELNRKLMLARKYGFDEYSDELVNLLAKLDRFRKYGA